MGRDASGVQGMRLRGDDEVISVAIAADDADLLVVTENGYGKRTRVSEYPKKGRGGMGVKTVQLTEARGHLVGARVVRDGYQVMLISTGGTVIKMPVDDVKRLGRSTQGVIVMRLREGEQRLVARAGRRVRRRDDADDRASARRRPDSATPTPTTPTTADRAGFPFANRRCIRAKRFASGEQRTSHGRWRTRSRSTSSSRSTWSSISTRSSSTSARSARSPASRRCSSTTGRTRRRSRRRARSSGSTTWTRSRP